MGIGIDISQIIYRGTGVGRFTRGLVESILEYDKKNKWFFFFSSLRNKLDKELIKNIQKRDHKIYSLFLPPTILSYLWNNLHLYNIDNILPKLDWFITSDWIEPPSNINKTTIVHDLVFKRYPETLDKKILNSQEKRFKWIKKESKIIFSDSVSTKKDLINFFRIDAQKIIVNYPGIKILTPDNDAVKKTLNKYSIKKEFILTVGKIEPRKNIQKLIDAFIKLKGNNIDLVIAGEYGWGNKLKTEKNVHILGYVDEISLFSLYKSCKLFIYPSFWEGFGYPVIEAMASGCAVATSNISSLKEIAGDSALLFDPNSIESIKSSILKLIENEDLRKSYIKKGYLNWQKYNWKNYYELLINNLYNYKNI